LFLIARQKSSYSGALHILLFIILFAAAAFAAAATEVTVKSSGPRLSRILRTEVSWSEKTKAQDLWPGTHSIKMDRPEADLELRLWELNRKFVMEFVLNTADANVEILSDPKFVEIQDPTDGTGFFWAQLAGGARMPVDLRCVSKTKKCTGKWEDFPFVEGGKQVLRVFSSMRGFKKREWVVNLEPGKLEKIPAGSMPQTTVYRDAHGTDPGGEIRETILFGKESYKSPFTDQQYSPIRIDQWIITKRPSDAGIGFHKQPRSVLFEVTDGVVRIDVLFGKQHSTFEVRKGERLWTPAESGIAVRANGGKGQESAVLRRAEFP